MRKKSAKQLAVLLAVVLMLAVFGVTGCTTTGSGGGDPSVSRTSERDSDCPDPKQEIPAWMINCPDGV